MKSYICPRKCDKECKFFNEYSKKCTFDENSYQQGKYDEQNNILWWFHNHDYVLAERVMNQYLEEMKE